MAIDLLYQDQDSNLAKFYDQSEEMIFIVSKNQ
ncbi:hypothetical protein Xish_03379 [Xenorhabdus ishibashii]|uniref:Uncharacterized protein n=1 Tax=Xenorhabdus ishibashii TaxID=1034471 RepID=A0A2D0K9U9_9GAMM|nr:hypothetical protein Xish_03379 [Xenorhabdus ishibashii]